MPIKPHTPIASAWVNLAAEYEAKISALRIAMHDAINRPKGVVPASAEPFYSAALCDALAKEPTQ